MGRDITVQIRASAGTAKNGERAIYFLDGISAPDTKNTWSYPHIGAFNNYSTDYTLVMPAGGGGTWMTDWVVAATQGDTGTKVDQKWETFLAKELPSYVNANFGSSTSGNALVGLSMSAGPALNLVERHPEVYSAVESISGFYQTSNPVGYFIIPLIQSYVMNYTNGSTAMWGNPLSNKSQWNSNDASLNIKKLRANGQYAIVTVGNGTPSAAEWKLMYDNGGLANVAVGAGLEIGSYLSTKALQLQAILTGAPIKFVYSTGTHGWPQWERTLPANSKLLQDYLATLPAPKMSVTVSSASALGTAPKPTTAPAPAVTTRAVQQSAAAWSEPQTTIAPKTRSTTAVTHISPDNSTTPGTGNDTRTVATADTDTASSTGAAGTDTTNRVSTLSESSSVSEKSTTTTGSSTGPETAQATTERATA